MEIDELQEKVDQQERMIASLYTAVRRLEALQGISEPPAEWGITTDRIVRIAETEGISMIQAKERLIMNFGLGEG